MERVGDRPPAARNRLPAHIITCELTKPKSTHRAVVVVASLSVQQLEAVKGAFSSHRTLFARGRVLEASTAGTVYRVSSAKDAVDMVCADRFAEVCYPITPALGTYSAGDSHQSYVPVSSLGAELEADVDAIMAAIPQLHPDDVFTGSVENDVPHGQLKRREAPFPHCHVFVSLSVAVSWCPEHRDQLVNLAFNTTVVPRLSIYQVAGSDSSDWISVLDLSIAVDTAGFDVSEYDEDDEQLSFVDAMVQRKANMCNAIRSGDGLLSSRHDKRGSGLFVSVNWLRTKQPDLWAAIKDEALPAVPGAPILIQTNTPKVRQRSYPKGARLSTVSMTLKRRLREPMITMPLLMEVVNTVRCQAEFSSLLLNLHVMRLLDDGGGRLNDGDGPDVFNFNEALVRKAMTAVRTGVLQHPGLATTFQLHADVLQGFVNPALCDVGNSTKYEAVSYVTNALSSIGNHGSSRIASLLSSTRRLFGGEPGSVRRCVEYIEGRGTLPPDLPPELRTCADKYRLLYSEKGLLQFPGFVVHDLPKRQQPTRHRRILELFWHINSDHRKLCDMAVATGRWRLPQARPVAELELVGDTPDMRDDEDEVDHDGVKVWGSKQFSPLPVTSLIDRHVLVDGDTLARKLFKTASASGTFTPGDVSSFFKQDGAARSLKQGWRRAPLFRTDGTALKELWFLPKDTGTHTPSPLVTRQGQGDPSKPLQATKETTTKKTSKSGGKSRDKDGYAVSIPAGARKVGDDPGDVNEHYTCEILPSGPIFHVLSRTKRDTILRPLKESRERRVAHHASLAVAALSGTRKKTYDVDKFRAYTRERWCHRVAIGRAFQSRAARSEKFESQRLMGRRLDRYINRVIDGGKRGHGGRRRGMLYWGEGNGTRSAMLARRLNSAHSAWVTHLWVDEWGTTKYDCITNEELAPAYRRGIRAGGQAGWIKDRDVRFRKSEHTLESRHPCPYPTPLLVGKGFREDDLLRWEAVDRDGNAAYAINLLAGVAEEHREPCYRRTRESEDPYELSSTDVLDAQSGQAK